MQATDHSLDLLGLKCPLPALKTAKYLKGVAPGGILRVLCSDPMSVIDIPNLVRETGDALVDQRQEEATFVFVIRKGG